MFTLIQKEIAKAGCHDLLASGVVITGGSAGLPGITQIAEHAFNLPVRTGVAESVGGLLDLIKGPEYAAAVGLVLHGAAHSGLTKGRATRGAVGSTVRRVVGWFSEHF
jgi:cell division protein FtsA